jgi:hypothetical protein
MKLLAVVLTLLLAIGAVFAAHMVDDDERTLDGCPDINPHDSINTCDSEDADDSIMNPDRMTTVRIRDAVTVGDTVAVSDTTSREWVTLRCMMSDTASGTAAGSDMMLRCYVVNAGTTDTGTTETTSDATVMTGTSWSDRWDYNNPTRVTASVDAADGMTIQDDDETRGFESPVVYRNDLDTTRTSPEQAD